jgi:Amt family ammonium transporter
MASHGGVVTTGRVVVVTTLAGGAGGLALLAVGKAWHGIWDLGSAMNGVLGGLVSVCAGCNVVDVWAGIVIGGSGAVVMFFAGLLLERLRVDDPLGAAPMHLGAGLWGLVVGPGLFGNPALGMSAAQAGLFYGGSGETLGWALVAGGALFAWSFGLSLAMFGALSKLKLFRVTADAEALGMDLHHHGGAAYDLGGGLAARDASAAAAGATELAHTPSLREGEA